MPSIVAGRGCGGVLRNGRCPRSADSLGVLVMGVVFVVLLLWAKWLPYSAKVIGLDRSHTWSGTSILEAGGVRAGDAPTWHAGASFLVAYLVAAWKALVAALLISAALQVLIPRDWLLRTLNRRGRWSSAVAGGLLSTPSMMCTCCTAPVAVSLRRSGASTTASVAYWLGNPLLNPAVVAFLLLVTPWQWTATRVGVGVVTVVAGAVLVGRLTDRGRRYVAVVLLIGAFRGWLLPLARHGIDGGIPAVLGATVIAALLGTLFVIPTAGEIPIVQGLAVVGLPPPVLGALLITLPAVSLPSMVMVHRALGRTATLSTAALTVLAGLAGGLVLWALSWG